MISLLHRRLELSAAWGIRQWYCTYCTHTHTPLEDLSEKQHCVWRAVPHRWPRESRERRWRPWGGAEVLLDGPVDLRTLFWLSRCKTWSLTVIVRPKHRTPTDWDPNKAYQCASALGTRPVVFLLLSELSHKPDQSMDILSWSAERFHP